MTLKRSVSAAALAAGLAALGSAAAAQDCTTRIGAIFPTSVDWGQPIAETAQWVVDQVNEAGGAAGCRIEMVLRDDQLDPRVGVDAARALVDLDGVQLLLGTVASGISMPILTSVTVPSGVMQMSCCSSATSFTRVAEEGGTDGLWFRTFATTGVQAAVGVKVAQEQGWESVTILYKNDDWGQDIGSIIAGFFEAAGIEVKGRIAINDGQPSFRGEVVQALGTDPDALYLALYPLEGTTVVREWLSLGGTQNMIVANSLKSDDFRNNVGLQFLGNTFGTDTASPRADSADTFVARYRAHFGSDPTGPGLANSYDAAFIALLAMEAAGPGARGADIAAAVPRVTDPDGTPIDADVEGFAMARDILADGGTVMFQGATGNVRFDANGDVSAPAVIWAFTEDGIAELEYLSLEEVDSFIAALN